jgi:hypothetical protein
MDFESGWMFAIFIIFATGPGVFAVTIFLSDSLAIGSLSFAFIDIKVKNRKPAD